LSLVFPSSENLHLNQKIPTYVRSDLPASHLAFGEDHPAGAQERLGNMTARRSLGVSRELVKSNITNPRKPFPLALR
jgi:hypothetical protein